MRFLSIYNDYPDAMRFLYENDFITREEYGDENYDLLKWFEGDPDFLDDFTCGIPRRVYFAHFHPDYKLDNEDKIIVFTTAEIEEYHELLEDFFKGGFKKWTESVQEFEKTKADFKIWYRGGSGYVYSLYSKNIEEL